MTFRRGYVWPCLWWLAGPLWAAGPLERVPNATLLLPETPPTAGYTTTNAFPGLSISVVCIASPPGETNRLFLVERSGRIQVITNLANPNITLFLDLSDRVRIASEGGLLGLAFHPGYRTNRYFFVYYTLETTTDAGTGPHDRLSRFEISPDDPNAALPDSEVPLLTQFDEDVDHHNAGDIHFGSDGYLYLSLGDEGGYGGLYDNSQRIDKDFFSGILRIDVDQRPGSLPPNGHPASTPNYRIPPDNPFVGATNFNGVPVDPNDVRTEFWAVGLRNPWRMSFDEASGYLYCGDVGQGEREEVDIITKGGNYGWNYREGTVRYQGQNSPPPPEASFLEPILDYQRMGASADSTQEGNCVIGGVVYHGTGIPQLTGDYVFGDYISGNIWGVHYDGASASNFRRLANLGAAYELVCFGTDPSNGDVLMGMQLLRQISRLIYSTNVSGTTLPATLAETGAFSDLATLTPNPGIVSYDVNVSFWSDHARKRRWFSVPDTNQAIGFEPAGNWSFPAGTVWIKHFDLELTNGVPESAKRLETRFLVRNAEGVYGITYRWGDSATNATLVPEEGMDESFVIHDGGTIRTQVWHYPARNECLACHTAQGGWTLGFNTPQLNRLGDYGGTVTNQIQALSDAGYFEAPVENVYTLRSLVPATNDDAGLEFRVRSYLAANCSQCHQPGGAGQGLFDARLFTPLSQAGLVNGTLLDDGGDGEARVIRPGSLDHSKLLERISTLGPERMPPIGSSVLDLEAVDLVGRWITNGLANFQSFTDWQTNHFGSTNSPESLVLADPDLDGGENELEFLTGTDPRDPLDYWSIGITRSGEVCELTYPRVANRGFEVQFTDSLDQPAPPWRVLNVPENRPFFSATNGPVRLRVPISNTTSRLYRVRVYEP
jgi:uncharacterized repeat protein (TIGR03806 family)